MAVRQGEHRRNAQPSPAGLTARASALALLDRVLVDGDVPEGARLAGSHAERAEARSLADTTLRRLGEIDAIIDRFVGRPPSGTGRQILRLMTGELVFAGTQPHAAVDLAVRLARRSKRTSRLAGLTNAVGRKIAALPKTEQQAVDGAARSTPEWLRRALTDNWGPDVAGRIMTAHLTPAPHDLTLKVVADAEPLAAETGGTLLPTGSVRLPGRPQISALPGFDRGAWWVQDAAAALPAQLFGDLAGRRVLDLCAAPGGKAMQLAAAGANTVAVDRSVQRLERLKENLSRTGLHLEVIAADALEWQPEDMFDAILLDAPCSASGTIRRHPDLPHRTDGSGLAGLVDLQARLLDRAFGMLSPGGTLVFCTCSLFRAEGEDIIASFLERTPDAGAVPIGTSDAMPPEFVTGDGWLRTRPDHWAELGHLDGFFAARVTRG